MRLTTTKEKVLNAVLIAERIVGKKESLPILSCILLDVQRDLSIRSTNLEAGVDIQIPCEVEEKGMVAVSAGVLSQTLRSIMGDKVVLKTEEGNLVIESRGTKTLIKAVPHEEFPALSSGKPSPADIPVLRERLLRGIQAVSYAASPSMIRPELGSVYVRTGRDGLSCVATDSFRLAEKIIPGKVSGESELLVPLKHALELAHILERAPGEEVRLAGDESQLTVSADGIRFVSRVVDGTFPNYKDIIPKSFSTEATVLKNDLAETLRKARVFSGNDQHVGLHVYPKKKICRGTGESAKVVEMSDSIDAALTGDDLDINFHIGYIADCLASIESDSVILAFSGPGKPLVIRGISDQSFTYLVMPLNR